MLVHSFQYMLKWQSSYLLYGPECNGKCIMIKLITDYIYVLLYSCSVNNLDKYLKKFSSHTINKLFIYIEKIKNTKFANDKFMELIIMLNYPKYCGICNHTNILSITENNRRFFFTKISKIILIQEYLDKSGILINQNSINKFYNFLIHFEIKVNIRKIPKTNILKDCVKDNIHPIN